MPAISVTGTDDWLGEWTFAFPQGSMTDEPIYLASPADLAQVYARPSVATAKIGTLHQDTAVPAYILTNELFGKHFSVVGTTGSGKSCVVATILSAVIERNPNAHVMLIDPHGEYARAVEGKASVRSVLGEGAFVLQPIT